MTPQTLDSYGAATGTNVRPRGLFDPDTDPLWQQRVAGQLMGDDYWAAVAREAGFEGWRELFRADRGRGARRAVRPDAPWRSCVTPEPLAVVSVCSATTPTRSTGRTGSGLDRSSPVSMPSSTRPTSVSASLSRDAFLAAATALGLEPSEIVFLDDLPASVEAARAVGMTAIHVDPLCRAPAFELARHELGLG